MSNTYTTGTGQVIERIHDRKACCGERCVIHNPSNHAMKDFPTHWRDDRKLTERLCPHGIGHPDPDALAFIEKADPNRYVYESIHGCDGCCRGAYGKTN